MNMPSVEALQHIYNALSDDVSRKIYRHRLLYSLLNDEGELTKVVYECSKASPLLRSSKVCYYGAGAGASWLTKYDRKASFIIDKNRTGTLNGLCIISLDDFLKLPDCKEYLIIITVGKSNLRHEIASELDAHNLRYVFGFNEMLYCDQQYFDLPQLYMDKQKEHFVDAGALDGETTKYFLKHFEKGHAYVLEPNPKQFAVAKECLRDYPEVEIFPYGAYDRNMTLRFDPQEDDESCARIAESGSIEIEVRRLDDLLGDRKVTFLKMDIEGSELAALRGAERIIREQRPKLAICVYHKPEDMWEIPRLILQYHSDYRLYLRHYTITSSETVLYAI